MATIGAGLPRGLKQGNQKIAELYGTHKLALIRLKN